MSTPDLKELRKELRKLHEAAHPAPWGCGTRLVQSGYLISEIYQPSGDGFLTTWLDQPDPDETTDLKAQASAALTVAARNALPYLLDELERLSAANEALRNERSYIYIGRDGKPVQARDVEDRAERAEAALSAAKAESAERSDGDPVVLRKALTQIGEAAPQSNEELHFRWTEYARHVVQFVAYQFGANYRALSEADERERGLREALAPFEPLLNDVRHDFGSALPDTAMIQPRGFQIGALRKAARALSFPAPAEVKESDSVDRLLLDMQDAGAGVGPLVDELNPHQESDSVEG